MTIESKYDAIASSCGAFTYDAISVTRFDVHHLEIASFNTSMNTTSTTISNKPTAGGHSISVLGRGFGSEDYSSSFGLSGTTLATSNWISDSSVVSKIVAGYGRSVRISLTSEGSVSSGSEIFSYDSAYLSINMTHPVNRASAHGGGASLA